MYVCIHVCFVYVIVYTICNILYYVQSEARNPIGAVTKANRIYATGPGLCIYITTILHFMYTCCSYIYIYLCISTLYTYTMYTIRTCNTSYALCVYTTTIYISFILCVYT